MKVRFHVRGWKHDVCRQMTFMRSRPEAFRQIKPVSQSKNTPHHFHAYNARSFSMGKIRLLYNVFASTILLPRNGNENYRPFTVECEANRSERFNECITLRTCYWALIRASEQSTEYTTIISAIHAPVLIKYLIWLHIYFLFIDIDKYSIEYTRERILVLFIFQFRFSIHCHTSRRSTDHESTLCMRNPNLYIDMCFFWLLFTKNRIIFSHAFPTCE